MKNFIIKTVVVTMIGMCILGRPAISYAATEEEITALQTELEELRKIGPSVTSEIRAKEAEIASLIGTPSDAVVATIEPREEVFVTQQAPTPMNVVIESRAIADIEEGIGVTSIDYVIEEDATIVTSNSSNRWDITLSPEEFDIIARIGELECGGEGDLGQQAVFEVIFNRVLDPEFASDPIGVVSQRGQFSTWRLVHSNRATPSQKIIDNLNVVLNGESYALPTNTLYFSMRPQNKRIQTKIGCHYFCNK